MDPDYPLRANIAIHLGLSVFDLAINAAAGAAAAATGAHVNGDPTTNLVIHTGVFAGLIKSGVLNFAVLIAMLINNVFVDVLVFVLGTSFGTVELVTLAVGRMVLGRNVNALFIAAAAAAAPMLAGTAIVQASGNIASVMTIGWDALSGYTFARVAENHGFHVCEYKSAAAAGAVYGVLVWFIRLPLSWYLDQRERERERQARRAAIESLSRRAGLRRGYSWY